jgi:hypothetical protein
MTRCCVYTVLYGPDEPLPEQPVRADSAVDFIAFVGDPALMSGTWQVRHLPPLLPDDPVRSSRYVKMHPHVLLPDYDASLYIDCAVLLRRPPEAFFAQLLFGVTDTMSLLRHCQRSNIAEEADAVATWNLDDPLVCAEQMQAYALDGHAGTVPLIWGGLLLRFHNDPRVVACMETWFAHVMAFSRRDQLAFPHVAEKLGFPFHALDFDTRDSDWHRWPIDPYKQRAPWSPIVAAPPVPPPCSPARLLWDVGARLDRLGAAAVQHTERVREAVPQPWAPPPRDLPVATVALRQLRASLRTKRDALAAATAALATANSALAAQMAEIGAIQDSLNETRAALAESRAALAHARAQLQHATVRYAELQSQDADRLSAVYASTSWRITGPLRRCVEALRGRLPVR